MKDKTRIVIVGGGPVGLFLGLCLEKSGIDCLVLEMRKEPVPDSRSLGIHPPSLRLFEKLNIIEPFLKSGLKIKTGLAYNDKTLIGEVDFAAACPKPYNYILACPQSVTEDILRKEFLSIAPDKLLSKAQVHDLHLGEKGATVFYKHKEVSKQVAASFVIGCDGKNSLVRQKAGIFFGGKRYPDTYVMGDFEDTTSFGDQATVFLTKPGMIECFPLPNGMRRWVVKTDQYISEPTADNIVELVKTRVNFDLSGIRNTMISSFGVQHFIAETFYKKQVLLCGDAAHVISPIGGQGMNLGWIGAWDLASSLSTSQLTFKTLNDYERFHQKRVKKAARRAKFNMALGRKQSLSFLRSSIIRLMINTPLKNKMARQFTMQDLLPKQKTSTA